VRRLLAYLCESVSQSPYLLAYVSNCVWFVYFRRVRHSVELAAPFQLDAVNVPTKVCIPRAVPICVCARVPAPRATVTCSSFKNTHLGPRNVLWWAYAPSLAVFTWRIASYTVQEQIRHDGHLSTLEPVRSFVPSLPVLARFTSMLLAGVDSLQIADGSTSYRTG